MIEYIAYALSFFAVAIGIKMIFGPTMWDRLLYLNLITVKILMIISIYATITQKNFLLDIALSYALLSFISTLFMAEFIMKKGL